MAAVTLDQPRAAPVTAPTTTPNRRKRLLLALALVPMLATAAALLACTEAPSWQKLLAARITQHYPAYTAQPTTQGGLLVERPGLPAITVDVDAIARFCLRGPKDCNYATDQMLLELQGK